MIRSGSIFRHNTSKKLYEYLGEAIDSDSTCEPKAIKIIYKSLDNGKVILKHKDTFFELFTQDNKVDVKKLMLKETYKRMNELGVEVDATIKKNSK